MATSAARAQLERRKSAFLNSWKEIAAYLGRGVRTVQRWHCELHLPVHKVRPSFRSPVFAYKSELDFWMKQNAERSREDSNDVIAEDCGKVAPAAWRTTKMAGEMQLIIGKQHDRLKRVSEQVNRLVQLQKTNRAKLSSAPPKDDR